MVHLHVLVVVHQHILDGVESVAGVGFSGEVAGYGSLYVQVGRAVVSELIVEELLEYVLCPRVVVVRLPAVGVLLQRHQVCSLLVEHLHSLARVVSVLLL